MRIFLKHSFELSSLDCKYSSFVDSLSGLLVAVLDLVSLFRSFDQWMNIAQQVTRYQQYMTELKRLDDKMIIDMQSGVLHAEDKAYNLQDRLIVFLLSL